jgi:hypothetical protein
MSFAFLSDPDLSGGARRRLALGPAERAAGDDVWLRDIAGTVRMGMRGADVVPAAIWGHP